MLSWGFSTIDQIAFGFFAASWVGHFYIVNRSPLHVHTITYHMKKMRILWMRTFLQRNPRMFDVLIQNQLQQGVLFFASTSILIVGAMLAGLGSADEAIDLLADLPMVAPTTRIEWDIKMMLVTCIFVYTFFKFAWSYRQFNYFMITAGSAPEAPDIAPELLEAYAQKLAAMHSLAALHFTTGLNAYFFALAAFAWFLNAWAFIIATVWITIVMYRRAFASRFMRILSEPDDWFVTEKNQKHG